MDGRATLMLLLNASCSGPVTPFNVIQDVLYPPPPSTPVHSGTYGRKTGQVTEHHHLHQHHNNEAISKRTVLFSIYWAVTNLLQQILPSSFTFLSAVCIKYLQWQTQTFFLIGTVYLFLHDGYQQNYGNYYWHPYHHLGNFLGKSTSSRARYKIYESILWHFSFRHQQIQFPWLQLMALWQP